MDRSLEELVRQRANRRCEYCGLPEQFSSIPFEIDHVIAEQHHGRTAPSNLALACFADNHRKGPNLSSIDPKTRKRVWLYNPRRQKWSRHFRWEGGVIVGRTAVGRATVALFQLNEPHRVAQRAALMEEGVWPLDEPFRSGASAISS